MDIIEKSRNEQDLADSDYRDDLEIYVDGERVFRVSDGEPEDATLSRDFNDCYSITSLMKKAYDAGVGGEPFNITYEDLEG